MFNSIIKRLPVIAFLCLVCVPVLVGQTSGSVSGHVDDATKASIPAALVTLKNVATGTERTTVTTGAGDYTFTEVPVGVYTVSATHAGFKTSSSDNVEVQVQQSIRLDFSLQVGAVTQSIEVQATGALLQADNSALGTVIDNAAVNELPLNGRNYLSLVALASNVNTLSPASGQAGSRLGGDRASQSIAVGGQRIMFDYYTLDGVNNTDPDFNTYVALPSLDGIQEFKVQTGVYSAEYGHEASQVNVVSKSGTNTFHGAAYEFIRNNYVDANPYFFPYNAAPPSVFPYKWNDFGFELDGPIWIPKVYNGKNKFFFMVDDEWRRIRTVVGPGYRALAGRIARQFSGLHHCCRNSGYHLRSGNRRRQRTWKTALSQQYDSCGKNQLAVRGVAEVLCVQRKSILCERVGSFQLLVQHIGTTGSPGPDSPWRLQSVPEVAVFLPLQLGRRNPYLDRFSGRGQQDFYSVLPVHGLQHVDAVAPRC